LGLYSIHIIVHRFHIVFFFAKKKATVQVNYSQNNFNPDSSSPISQLMIASQSYLDTRDLGEKV